MTRRDIHINCDMGESYGRYTLVDDAELMQYINACNIACGFHAGDPFVIDNTIKSAIDQGIEIGAHPSYPDRQGFGRRYMQMTERELETFVRYQIAAVKGMVESHGAELTHVKAHGALYNRAAQNIPEARAIAQAVVSFKKNLSLYAPFNSVQAKVAKELGIQVLYEAFIDRRYNPDLSLVSRLSREAIISDPTMAKNQVTNIHSNQKVATLSGEMVDISADTFCIHGDNPAAISILQYLNREE